MKPLKDYVFERLFDLMGVVVILFTIPILIYSTKAILGDDSKDSTQIVAQDTLEYKQDFYSKNPKEGLLEALMHYEVKHPNIVYAQAVLETGNFKSELCVNSNNLFGLYNSKKSKYHTFNHWTESVIAYKNYIQYKHKDSENYYAFLQRIGYAEDPNYINKLKQIVNSNDTRRSK